VGARAGAEGFVQGITAGTHLAVHVPKEMAVYAPTPMMNLSQRYAAPVTAVAAVQRPVRTAAARSLYVAADSTRAEAPVPHVNVAAVEGCAHAGAGVRGSGAGPGESGVSGAS
jgi:hypothetical protein